MTMNTEINQETNNIVELHSRTPLAFKKHVEDAVKDCKHTWVQGAGLRTYKEWEQRGRPTLVFLDLLTKQGYVNPENAYLLEGVATESFTPKMIKKNRHPALSPILDAEEHEERDCAGVFGREYMDTIEAEDSGLSFLDNFVPNYAWHEQCPELSKEEVDALWRYFSDQCWQSIYASVTGGVAQGMFVFIADGGLGKSTYIETLARLTTAFTVEAFRRKGLTIKNPSCLSATDNMTGNTPQEWMLRGFFLNCQTVYFTEKAGYLTNPATLELFKGVLTGSELSFRKMFSEETQRGRQRATAFLDFNPTMANTLLSGKLGEDTATARRFLCLNIAEARAEAWHKEPSGKGRLKLEALPEETQRFWRQVKWAGTQSPYQLGVIPPELVHSFSKLIKGLAARSGASSAGIIRGYLAEETKLIVSPSYLAKQGVKSESLSRIGDGAVKDLLWIPKDKDDRRRVMLKGYGQKRLRSTEWLVLKPNWDWERIRKQIRSLWESRPIDAPCDEQSITTWLDALMWREIDDRWELINSLQKYPLEQALE